MALFAHCVALTVNAVKLPWERRPRALATADRLAEAVSLDMTAHWAPTVRTYLGRVTKAHMLAAVREAVWRRGGGPHGGHEEAGDGGSRRAASGRNRLAASADADAASRPRACEPPQADAVTEESLTRTPSPPSKRHGRDRSCGPGLSSCDCRNFWLRAFRRAAILMMLKPSIECILQESETFLLEAGGAGRVVVSAR